MSPIVSRLANVLGTVRRPGDFFVSGTTEIPAPRLEVDGVGVVALPLLPAQAEQLVAVAERSPYGRGADTLVDTGVRRTWQIGADRVRIGGRHWARAMEGILARVAEGLGLNEPIAAELYKLLIYDQGSFFVSHHDTEKAPGMFATLVVVLPSVSTGGELVVRHKGREISLDLHCDEPSEAVFAAFYADCLHEVRPVTSGCRLTLVYNLLRMKKGPKPKPPSYQGEQDVALALLREWAVATQSPDDDAPEKLVYPLEHAYTVAELGFDKLKGADAAVASALLAASSQAGCDLHLAQISVEESGVAEYVVDFNPRRGRWSDEAEFEAGEVYDRHVTLSEWRQPDGSPSALGELPVEDEEICPPDGLDDMVPDQEHFHEATGNEGASFERTYRRAALVLWPRERMFAVLNQAGLSVTLPYLGELTERWVASRKDRQSLLWQQAHELAEYMLFTWPMQQWYPTERKGPSEVVRMLTLLTRLADTERIDEFADSVIAGGRHEKGDGEAILGALRLLSQDRAAALLKCIVTGTAATSLGACGDLLAHAVRALPVTSLVGAATVMVELLPGDPSRAPPQDPWRSDPSVQSSFVIDLFNTVGLVDETLAMRAADHVLAWPKTYGLDTVLVPAVRQLIESVMIKDGTVQRLRIACLGHLRARVAEPLEAPRDWRRASNLACRCSHCGELNSFLADPERKTWTLKAAEAARGHVEGTIRKARCDLDVVTDRHGRPYSLICSKNQASYDRRVKQRSQDLENLKLLEG
jgi:2-oxoglutarate-Fe(II)-dependent oxygenase superfamily protein